MRDNLPPVYSQSAITNHSAAAPDEFIHMLHAAFKLAGAPGIPMDLSNIQLCKIMELAARAGIVLKVKFTKQKAAELCE